MGRAVTVNNVSSMHNWMNNVRPRRWQRCCEADLCGATHKQEPFESDICEFPFIHRSENQALTAETSMHLRPSNSSSTELNAACSAEKQPVLRNTQDVSACRSVQSAVEPAVSLQCPTSEAGHEVGCNTPAIPFDSCCGTSAQICRAGHLLQKYLTPYAGFTCDICRKVLPQSSATHFCRTCNFDVCCMCAVSQQLPLTPDGCLQAPPQRPTPADLAQLANNDSFQTANSCLSKHACLLAPTPTPSEPLGGVEAIRGWSATLRNASTPPGISATLSHVVQYSTTNEEPDDGYDFTRQSRNVVTPSNPLPFAENFSSTLSYQGSSGESIDLASPKLIFSRRSDDKLLSSASSNVITNSPARSSASLGCPSFNERREGIGIPKLPLTSKSSLQGARALLAEMLTSEDCPSSAVGSATAEVTRTRAVSDGGIDYFSPYSCSESSFKSPSSTRGANNSRVCCSTSLSSTCTSARSASSTTSSGSASGRGTINKSAHNARPNPLLRGRAGTPGRFIAKDAFGKRSEQEQQSSKCMLEPLNGRMSWFPSASFSTPKLTRSLVKEQTRSFQISEWRISSPLQERSSPIIRSRSSPAVAAEVGGVDKLDVRQVRERHPDNEELDSEFCQLLSAALLEA